VSVVAANIVIRNFIEDLFVESRKSNRNTRKNRAPTTPKWEVRRRTNGAEQQIESEKIVEFSAARSKRKLAACGCKAIEEGGQIDFEIGLEARFGWSQNSGV
jgi:hypothetical protein